MRTMHRRQWVSLALAFVILLVSAAVTVYGGRRVKDSWYETKQNAARQMQQCMDRVKEYKLQLGVELIPEDIHATGMLGADYTGITTTLGALEAKRTTANADMAAMVVQMLVKAGVRPGDTVGAGFSGSFPSLDLAVLCARDAMGVRCVYVASVGSSTYGANQPELTFPDMALRLVQDGLISTLPAAITPGGARDVGQDMDPDLLAPILERLEGSGVPLWKIPDYQSNLAARMELYEREGPIVCFIGVGGNLTTLGRWESSDLGQGVLSPDRGGLITQQSGLVEIYRAKGIPVINLLNVKKLVADYGLAFDPAVLPEPGTSAVYYRIRYSRWPALTGLAAAAAVLLWGFRRGKRDSR